MKKIKNIIFDFGGVLLNLDRQACIDAFVSLGFDNVDTYLNDYRQKGIFRQLEMGEVSVCEFFDGVRKAIGKPISDEQIADAWAQFVLDVPDQKLNLLLELQKKYRVFMLSNTNDIHVQRTFPRYFEKDGHTLSDYFEKVYLSNELNMTKPDACIFEYVLQDASIQADETLFIDDAEPNVEAARELGFQTYQAKPGDDLSFLLSLDCSE